MGTAHAGRLRHEFLLSEDGKVEMGESVASRPYRVNKKFRQETSYIAGAYVQMDMV